MPKFKPKTNKNIKVDKKSILTVDKKHHDMLESFKDNEERIVEIRKHIKSLKTKLKKETDISICLELEDEIQSHRKKIKIMQKDKKQYYLDNSKYIFDYFENKKHIIENKNQKVFMNEFFKIKDETTTQEESKMNPKKYFINMDESFIDMKDYTENYDICETCQCEMISIDNEGVLVCNSCFRQKEYLIEHEKPSYKEPPKEVSFYAYKRINHFREIIAQFQAKESTQIDDDVIENIKNQIKKERISLNQLTNEKTKQILKNLGYNKYYEHISFIKEKLGIFPPRMSVELEQKLCNLFLEIQKPYSKYCPVKRVNFLNYYYVLYKLCELLKEDKYLPYFYMLKDPEKRNEQDEIWKDICRDLNWEFIRTP